MKVATTRKTDEVDLGYSPRTCGIVRIEGTRKLRSLDDRSMPNRGGRSSRS